ncbi:MAG: 50S ribosomal protein L21 [Candidatus Gracilibacteria bacterium]|nr:50S ribosomal protein L21 [Candidatus Gracilibacteria bacterium]
MLAVIELGGNQFTVKQGDIIDVKHLEGEIDSKVETTALLISDEDGKDTKIGTPMVEGSKVELKIVDQYKGDKIRVFKMKSKKRYSRNKGFRPTLTKLEVTAIS